MSESVVSNGRQWWLGFDDLPGALPDWRPDGPWSREDLLLVDLSAGDAHRSRPSGLAALERGLRLRGVLPRTGLLSFETREAVLNKPWYGLGGGARWLLEQLPFQRLPLSWADLRGWAKALPIETPAVSKECPASCQMGRNWTAYGELLDRLESPHDLTGWLATGMVPIPLDKREALKCQVTDFLERSEYPWDFKSLGLGYTKECRQSLEMLSAWAKGAPEFPDQALATLLTTLGTARDGVGTTPLARRTLRQRTSALTLLDGEELRLSAAIWPTTLSLLVDMTLDILGRFLLGATCYVSCPSGHGISVICSGVSSIPPTIVLLESLREVASECTRLGGEGWVKTQVDGLDFRGHQIGPLSTDEMSVEVGWVFAPSFLMKS